MTMTTTDLAALEPMGRAEALDLARVEYQRFGEQLRQLDDSDWSHPTDCTEWDVRDLAGHVVGMMWSVSKIRRFAAEQVASMRRGRRDGIDPVDAMTAIQRERMAELSVEQLLDRLDSLIEPAIAGRARLPEALASRATAAQEVNGQKEPWSLSYLFGPIIMRDTWLHRVADVAGAVDRAPRMDAAHDGRIVADVAAEWARRHGQPVRLHLGGPAGGRFHHGEGGPELELDTVAFCRMLSGRAEPSHELLRTQVPF